MTMILLAGAEHLSNDAYLNACKNAIATGDTDKVLLLAHDAENCVADLDMSLYGKLIGESLYKNGNHIARALLKQCSSEQIRAADPGLLVQALQNQDYQMASILAENGIDANRRAAEVIHTLTYRGNNRDFFKHLLERGMQVDNNNYSVMQACIKTDSVKSAKLLLERGMDFDRFAEWTESQGYAEKDGEVFSAVKEYWENEIKQQDASSGPEPAQKGGMTMGGM